MEILKGIIGNPVALLSQNATLDNTALNTILIIGIAVVVVILFFMVIYLLKCVKQLKPSENEKISSNQTDNIFAQITAAEGNDSELVAVITAAICAYMGNAVPADGLVVRSIRKVKSGR